MNDLMLKVENVSKEYRLGVIGGTTLRDELQRKKAELLHREDPTSIIGQEHINSRGKFMALSDVSFEVKSGEAIGIIGHNGAGKSTLLKLITQITAPTSGKIYLNGRVASMLEVGTGFHQELTGRENIYVNGAILGMTKKEIDAKINDIIEFSECAQFIDTPVKRYSSGMYVKLAFSVAAHLDSEILIMDEVLAVGDAKFQEKCLSKMRDVAFNEGRTVLYVSHNMSTIRKLCSRCIVLDHGKIIFDGDVEEAISLYMDISSGVEDLPVDLTKCKRHGTPSGMILLKKVEFYGKENTGFKYAEQIKMKLTWDSTTEIDKFYIRAHVKRLDAVCLGVSYGTPTICHKGENQAIYDIDLSELVPGKYAITLIGYELNAYGAEIRHECVEPAFNIEIQAVDGDKSFVDWIPAWGNIIFKEMIIGE